MMVRSALNTTYKDDCVFCPQKGQVKWIKVLLEPSRLNTSLFIEQAKLFVLENMVSFLSFLVERPNFILDRRLTPHTQV